MASAVRNTQSFRIATMVAITLGLVCGRVYAHPDGAAHTNDTAHPQHHESLGSQATNPVSPLMSIRGQYSNSPSSYNADGYSQAGIFQGVIPVPLSFKSVPRMVNRVTTPYLSTPDLGDGIGRKHGFGDSSLISLAVPNFGMKGAMLGLGTSLGIPTGGDNEFTGGGQWTLGPAAVYINSATKGLQWGMLVFQDWDIASTRSDAASVSKTQFQPILNIHFSEGWYIGLPDVSQVYDNKTNKWALNLGGVVGRVFPWRKQHLQMYGGVYYNPEDNDGIVSSEWTLKFNISFLIPE